MNSFLRLSPDVASALAARRPIVALESTVISHGMPYPENVETARGLEVLVRERGATPATIAIVDGAIRIGLTDQELLRLASGAEPVAKVSRRDVAQALAGRGLGATTVSATMIAAALAGIRVFATGGIGGVHRGGATTFDISADLTELARTPVAVVCAGAKSILDLGLTIEALETHGVPVLGYQTHWFPAFYCRTSAFPVSARVETARQVADICRTHWTLGLGTGLVVANPAPESHALDPAFVDGIIDAALDEAKTRGVAGKDVTPFLLARIKELTAGRSLETNVALIRNNAALAAEIATCLL